MMEIEIVSEEVIRDRIKDKEKGKEGRERVELKEGVWEVEEEHDKFIRAVERLKKVNDVIELLMKEKEVLSDYVRRYCLEKGIQKVSLADGSSVLLYALEKVEGDVVQILAFLLKNRRELASLGIDVVEFIRNHVKLDVREFLKVVSRVELPETLRDVFKEIEKGIRKETSMHVRLIRKSRSKVDVEEILRRV